MEQHLWFIWPKIGWAKGTFDSFVVSQTWSLWNNRTIAGFEGYKLTLQSGNGWKWWWRSDDVAGQVFCVIELAASERKLFVVYDDRGLLALVLVPRELMKERLWPRACCCIACCQSCTVCRRVVFCHVLCLSVKCVCVVCLCVCVRACVKSSQVVYVRSWVGVCEFVSFFDWSVEDDVATVMCVSVSVRLVREGWCGQ